MEEGEEAASREGPATPDVFVMEAAALGMMSLHSKALCLSPLTSV